MLLSAVNVNGDDLHLYQVYWYVPVFLCLFDVVLSNVGGMLHAANPGPASPL